MLTCQINSINYGNKPVLRNISFELKRGEFLLITGESASGKSTLLSFIAGILQKNKDVKIDGKCEFVNRVSSKSIAYISQDPETNLICNDVRSEILLNGSNNIDIIRKVLNIFNLNSKILERKAQNLSGGEQQLLAIVCAVLRDCQIYIFDEPTAMLDYENTMIVVESIKKLKEETKTIIVASHELDIWGDKEKHIHLSGLGKRYKQLNNKLLTCKKGRIVFEVKNISFGYRKNETLIDNLSFNIKSEDVLHITGRNGSGKTTLAKLLAGILKPKNGIIKLNGVPLKKYKHYLPKEFAFTFQNPNWQLLFETVSEEISYCANKYLQENRFDYKNFIYDVLDNTCISKDIDPRELSFGQRKFIANYSFFNFPKIHLFDEPEIALDSIMKKYFYDYIELRKAMGLISIIISHHTETLKEYVTKEIVLG
jgi:energy-coupling factor transport system ATP-binding protein